MDTPIYHEPTGQSWNYIINVRVLRAAGKFIVGGGPLFGDDRDDELCVDHVVMGEAEEVLPILVRDLECNRLQTCYRATRFPDLSLTPLPRWDLADLRDYAPLQIAGAGPGKTNATSSSGNSSSSSRRAWSPPWSDFSAPCHAVESFAGCCSACMNRETTTPGSAPVSAHRIHAIAAVGVSLAAGLREETARKLTPFWYPLTT